MHTSRVIVGTPSPPIDPDQVKIHLHAPAKYEEVALVSADSRGTLRWSARGTTDLVIGRLRAEAASLGANGLLNLAMTDAGAAPVLGTGLACGWGSPPTGYGIGASYGTTTPFKSASAVAIRVVRE